MPVLLEPVKKTFAYGQHTVTLETNAIARQATGSVLVTMGDTVLLVAVVGNEKANPSADFFPLTVNYTEKTYAGGKIPGGYFKREGKPADRETLISRLIDRPLRPLFPEGFRNEVQITVTLMSLDPDVNPDIPALFGASAALAISGIPFNGPVAAARVGYVNGEYLLNPSYKKTSEESLLDLVVAGTKSSVLMVESEAKMLSEEVMENALAFGHKQMQVVITAIEELVREVGKPRWVWEPKVIDPAIVASVTARAENELRQAYMISDKLERKTKIKTIYEAVVTEICTAESADVEPTAATVNKVLAQLEEKIVRNNILEGKPRIDGRDTITVRPIHIEFGKFPATHGSVVFTRGETQAIVFTTLGTPRDAQILDSLHGETKDPFMLHYNFPPYSVGETGFSGGPKRREIGHGMLAKRALSAVLPDAQAFPYVLRIVSEITESNGSSSMATVCGGSLSMMDAGVPVKAAVAGIAMGLIKEGDRFAVLTDILGDEDHLGDMDFKVAGTEEGVTALQMDIKIEGITHEIMQVALKQAKDARMHILGIMKKALDAPRAELSDRAPRIITIQINHEKIRDVIGKGGAMIREITEATGTTIDITDDGIVKIASVDGEKGRQAKEWVEDICAEIEVGAVYEGKVVKIMEFGAIVEVLPGQTGMVHISQISNDRVENIEDFLRENQMVTVKCIGVDRQGRVRLSIKEVEGFVSS